MKIEKIVYPPLYVNTYLIFDDSGNCICIDPGGEFRKIKEIIKDKSLEGILITHAHFDHILGIPFIENIEDISIYLPQEDFFLYKTAREYTKNFLGFDPGEFRMPDRFLRGGEKIKIGEIDINVHFVPGNTPGHLLYEIDKKIFCGDLIFAGSIGRTDFPESSWEKMKKSLLYVLKNFSDDCEIYPGHGPKTTLRNEKAENPFLIEIM